jgi:hypothetical protein
MFVNAKYRDWDPPQRQAFRQGLRAVLDERRANSAATERHEADGLT